MSVLREFLELSYDRLEELNLEVKQQRLERASADELREQRIRYLHDEKRIKAVTVCFTDLEGRFHMLDYDKKFILASSENLTFDGSSIRGFSRQAESDLRLGIDWSAFYWLPSDVFGPGKVLTFGEVLERDGTPYKADMRSRLKIHLRQLYEQQQVVVQAAPEIEGFLFRGRDVERAFHQTGRFDLVSTGGYYHSLPGDPMRLFMDRAAEVQRALGFQNEKDHPEVAPSQFEMNFMYSEALIAADQVQLYKLLCRQVAAQHDATACFLPKPVTEVNGSGMHLNLSLSRNGRNLFFDPEGADRLSTEGWSFVNGILSKANDICLVLNSSVNAYRRLDPKFEAPNEIKACGNDRSAMVRIPYGNERSSRIEVRSVGPDVNPYLALYSLIRTGLEAGSNDAVEPAESLLHSNILDAISAFAESPFVAQILGEDVQGKFAAVKQIAADRCPKQLGNLIKPFEVQFHHEVTNQLLWNHF